MTILAINILLDIGLRKDNNSGSIPKPSDWWELKKIFKFDDTYDKQVTTMVEKRNKI